MLLLVKYWRTEIVVSLKLRCPQSRMKRYLITSVEFQSFEDWVAATAILSVGIRASKKGFELREKFNEVSEEFNEVGEKCNQVGEKCNQVGEKCNEVLEEGRLVEELAIGVGELGDRVLDDAIALTLLPWLARVYRFGLWIDGLAA